MGFWHLSPLDFGGLARRRCANQQGPPLPLARSHHDGITRRNATLTPTVALRPIKGAAVLMKKVCD
jgi:hypothetical protein